LSRHAFSCRRFCESEEYADLRNEVLGRKVEDLLALQKTREALDIVDTRLRALEDRMTHLEANQAQLIVEARAAASAASTAVAGGVISDVVTRLTRLEMSAEQLDKPSSPEPRLLSPNKAAPRRRATRSTPALLTVGGGRAVSEIMRFDKNLVPCRFKWLHLP
jgi:hypothetical protein